LFTQLHKHSDRAINEIAKAEPDVQSIIAERVASGEVITAAQVNAMELPTNFVGSYFGSLQNAIVLSPL
jgi:thiamine biosynthesis protein ThiC